MHQLGSIMKDHARKQAQIHALSGVNVCKLGIS